MILLHGIMLIVALIVTPMLLTLCASRRRDLAFVAATTGALAIALNITIAVVLHVTHTPITARSLASVYLVLACLTVAVTVLRRPTLRIQMNADEQRLLFPGIALLLVVIFPYTHFTGIDTYKWQDLASSVRVDAALPWVVHPLSLLGFTPRSYPSAHPVQLATIQILGRLGVDGGFFVISVLTALLGTASAYALGLQFFKRKPAIAFALCYTMSPVFVRYAHWATGRGMFLALFPAFLALLLAKPGISTWLGIATSGALLCLSHKVGLVAVPLFILLTVAARALPRRSSRLALVVCSALPILAAAAIVTPSLLPFPVGQVGGLIRYGITRFAWVIPMAAIGLWGSDNLLEARSWRLLFPSILVAIPLAYERHMYGALLALPFMVLLGVQGILVFCQWRPSWTTLFWRSAVAFTLMGAIATVVHRSRIATPPALRKAALFLEQHDPRGPFQVIATGRTRTQVQAYVSGCPRICVNAGTNSVIRLKPPPPLRGGSTRDTLSHWVSYGRGFFDVSEVNASWYGENPKTYTIITDGQETRPEGATQIYDELGISIYETENR
ncbi:MAG: hypothetical protein HN700_19650 [Verrucomicrobia bacterium]|jgi:hypothetical protein|nr:hypothetical protein [Verrucomicrobiota bacterium]